MLLIFDLDGTILDTLLDLTNALNHTLKLYNHKTIEKEDTRRFLGNGIRNLIYRASNDELNLDSMFIEFKKYYEANATVYTKPYDGIYNLIYNLKNSGNILCCISNKRYEITDLLINKYFPNLFDLVLGDGMGFKRKPDSEIVNYAIDKLNINKDEVLFIGDSDIDAKTIIESNIKGCLVSYGYRDKEDLEKYMLPILDNVFELRKFINNQNK